MIFTPGNAQHIGTRSEQQDSFGFSDPRDRTFTSHAGVLAVVADGMGGMAGGKTASRTAVKAFLDAYKLKRQNETIPAALNRALHFAHEAVRAAAQQIGEENMGTTLLAAVTHGQGLYWISAGD